MLSQDTKYRLGIMLTSEEVADQVELRMISAAPADAAAAQAIIDSMDDSRAMRASIAQRLEWDMAGSGAEGREMARKINGAAAVLRAQANGNEVPATAATATWATTAPITLTSVATGTARNNNTVTLQVLAAAANPTNTVLAAFTGTAAAIVVTITPNDGTNNSATPVNMTTAQLVELINTGAVVGKSVTVTDASSRRALQTATGGGATNLADGGQGDGLVATFSGGTASSDADIAAAQSAMGSEPMSDEIYEALVGALTSRDAADDFRAAYDAMIVAAQAV